MFAAGAAASCTVSHPILERGDAAKLVRADALHLSDYTLATAATAAPPDDPKAVLERARKVVERPAPPECVHLTLARASASALANGLDLRVSLVEPSIAGATADAEAAKFEAVFAVDASNVEPISGGAEQRIVSPAIRLPLRAGGTATIAENFFAQSGNPSQQDTSLSFSIVQPLLRGGGAANDHASIVVTRLAAYQAASRTKLEAIRTIANAQKAYWTLSAAHQALEVQLDEYESSQKQVVLAEKLAGEGVVSSVEVTRARSFAARNVDGVLTGETNRRLAERELKRAMSDDALPVTSPTVLLADDDPVPVALRLDRDRLVVLAVANRMELYDAEVQIAIDEVLTDVSRNEALPKLDLAFRYTHGRAETTVSTLLGTAGNDRAVVLALEVPLGNEAAGARVRRAVLQRVRDEAVRASLEQAIGREVCDAADELEQNWLRVLYARTATQLATSAFEAETRQFRAGAVTSTEVLRAASDVADARLDEVRALRDYRFARIDLAFATGTVLGDGHVIWTPTGVASK